MNDNLPPRMDSVKITNRSLTNARFLYLFYYMAIGAYLPFINLYFQRIGLTGVQIGTLSAIPLLVMSSTSVIWGGIADLLRMHRRILNISLFLSPIFAYMLSQTTHYPTLVVIVIAFAFFSAPVMPLLDSSALDVVEKFGGTYGGLRVWGTIGWMVSTWSVGALIERFNIYWLFYSYIAFMGLSFFVSLFQPTRIKLLRSSFRLGVRKLTSHPPFVLFLLSIFLLAITMGAVNYFFSLYLDDLGAGEDIIGLAWAISAISEIPVMMLSGTIINRIGARGLLRIAFLTYACRWLIYSFIQAPIWVLGVQLLHGLSFGTFHIGGVTYVNEKTPEGLSTTAQSIFSTVSYGLGPIVGSLVGGYFYDTFGLIILYRILSLVTLMGFIIFLLIKKNRLGIDSNGNPSSQKLNNIYNE